MERKLEFAGVPDDRGTMPWSTGPNQRSTRRVPAIEGEQDLIKHELTEANLVTGGMRQEQLMRS